MPAMTVRSGLIGRAILGTAIAVALLGAASPMAQATDDGSTPPGQLSSFSGQLTSPARGTKTVHVNGDITLDPASCPRSPANGSMPYRTYAGLARVDDPDTWVIPRPWVFNIIYASVHFIDEYPTVEPGLYQLRAWGVYADPSGDVFRDCGALSGDVVSVVDRLTTDRGAATDDSIIVLGKRTVISFTEHITWTDGVVTDLVPRTAPGLTLQVRQLGTAAWATESTIYAPDDRGDSTRRTVAPTSSVEYRFLQNGAPSRSVTVTVAQPTMGRIVADASLSDTEVMMGSTVEISAALQTQYTDSVWRPSPVGTAFEVQVLPDGATEWIRLYRNETEDPGVARLRFPVDGAGRYRITSGGGIGASLPLSITQPTSQVAIEAPDLPTAVSPGLPIDLAAPIEVQYSDGIYRPAPDGTSYAVQFSAVGTRAAQRWVTVYRGTTRRGVAAHTIRPTRTGYWRVSLAGATSSAVLVRVRRP